MGPFQETNGYNTMGLVTMVEPAKNMRLSFDNVDA